MCRGQSEVRTLPREALKGFRILKPAPRPIFYWTDDCSDQYYAGIKNKKCSMRNELTNEELWLNDRAISGELRYLRKKIEALKK